MSTSSTILNSPEDYEKIATCIFENGLLLDTCALLLLITGLHKPSNIQKDSRLEGYDEKHFKALQRTVELAGKNIYSTLCIPPEISNLLINRDKNGHYNGNQYEHVKIMAEYFLNDDTNVIYNELNEILTHSELVSLGVTDISILYTADHQNIVTITEDQKLYNWLHGINRGSLLIDELINFATNLNLS